MRCPGEAWLDQDEVIDLVRAAQRDGPCAVDALLARLRPSFLAFFARRLEPDAAEDLAQIALIRIARGLRRIDPERAGQYAVTVALNRLRSERRRRAREATVFAPGELGDAVGSPASADLQVEYRDLARAVHRASVTTLPPDLRDVVLGLARGLSPSELAAQQHVTPVTIRRRLRRARALLRPALRFYADIRPAREEARPKVTPRVREECRYPGYRIVRSLRPTVPGVQRSRTQAAMGWSRCAALRLARDLALSTRVRRAANRWSPPPVIVRGNSEVLSDVVVTRGLVARVRFPAGFPRPPPVRSSHEPPSASDRPETAMRGGSVGRETGERCGEMMARYLGSAILSAFADDDVTEIYLNPRDGVVRFDTRSRGRVESGVRLDPHRVEMFLNAVAASLGLTLGGDRPGLEAELPRLGFRGSRLQGFVPPVTPAPAFTIRKPPAVVYSLDDYVAAGIVSATHRDAFRRAVLEHQNILIAGGTNSGKTTLANALLKEVTDLFPAERIVILEDTIELQCVATDHLALRTGPHVTLAQLVKSALRTSPNRIVVGEVRGSEALDLLDAWVTGHPGGVATVHASSAEGALLRLDRLAQRANVPPQRHLVAEAVHLIAVLQGSNAGRRVTDLVRVAGLDRHDQFVFHHSTTSDVIPSGGSV
jgi:type IV secretion system protein VirB11